MKILAVGVMRSLTFGNTVESSMNIQTVKAVWYAATMLHMFYQALIYSYVRIFLTHDRLSTGGRGGA